MPTLDVCHIRDNPELYVRNCLYRNCPDLAPNPYRIVKLMENHQSLQEDARSLRERADALQKQLVELSVQGKNIDGALKEAREVKIKLREVEKKEGNVMSEIEDLALAMPNMTSKETPREPHWDYICSVNADEKVIQTKDSKGKPIHHVDIGKHLGIIDFASADTVSGRRGYYLIGAGVLLEQALVSYALTFATGQGWTPVALPSVVYSHISAACGFHRRDRKGEQQVFNIAQHEDDKSRNVPEMSLTRTNDIALAGMMANKRISQEELPLRKVAASRCYRPEAGPDTQGLYNVLESTQVELFAWTKPEEEEMGFFSDEIIDIQTDILGALGITCRVLDMPIQKLSARDSRRVSIEAFFPFRAVGKTPDEVHDNAWGEIASVSFCTDYQSRRLATRMINVEDGTPKFPWTVNGTVLSVPRVIAALLEIGWDADEEIVRLPKALHQLMGTDRIERPKRDRE